MAITAAEATARARRWVLPALAGLALLGSCIRPDTVEPAPREAPDDVPVRRPPDRMPVREGGSAPEVRVGLVVGSAVIAIGGRDDLSVSDPAGRPVATIFAGQSWEARRAGTGVTLSSGAGVRTPPTSELVVTPRAPGGTIRLGTREFRGRISLIPARRGVTAVNHVGLEEYLLAVVGGEMGRRGPADAEALRAQAIVSRTYALRHRGRRRADGFDYYATVADQVYFGVGVENPLARDAVDATRGVVVTWRGAPIDAFFFSTCGGHTEMSTEVFRGAERPYLRSVADADADGTAYCAISPRYRWREEWTGSALRDALRRYLPGETGIAPGRVTRVRDIRVADRTVSGRVRHLVVSLPDGDVAVPSPSVREVLRPSSGDLLRSTAFSLRASVDGGQVERLVVEGSGAGHGVGMCQWGAVGRARAGQRHEEIIAAYYPGTTLERYY